MQVHCKFRHVKASEEVQEYVVSQCDKLHKYELKPVDLSFTFSSTKHLKRVDLHVRGRDLEIHAHSEAADYFTTSRTTCG